MSPTFERCVKLKPIKFNIRPTNAVGNDDILRFDPQAGHPRQIDTLAQLITRPKANKRRLAVNEKLSESPPWDSALLQPPGSLIQRNQLCRHRACP